MAVKQRYSGLPGSKLAGTRLVVPGKEAMDFALTVSEE